MSSQAVYCLSLQIRPPADDNAIDVNSSNTSNSLDKMQSDSIELVNQHTNTATSTNQSTLHQTTTHRLTSQPTGNIYLVRGARTENGQLILQNSHDLLSLLNNDDDKPILLQHQRIKTENGPDTSSASTVLFQPALKATSISDSSIILQTQAPNKKITNDTPSTGQIFLQQRLNKNGTSDGPILLQTLKRLDKSQPILVFRSAASNNHTTTSTITTTHTKLNSNNDDSEEYVRKDHTQQSQHKHGNIPLGSDGEPIKLPENLESLPRADHFPVQRHRWNTNEEIAAILISFDKHSEWQSKEVKTRPKSGSMLLYSRKKVRYRRDGYCWKKRKDGKTTREDHMKLKVQGTECIYGCYVHSAILPTFHRRCYWLLQNPDIVLVHYLNVPYPDDNKMAVIAPSLSLWGDKKEWTKEELVSQLKPMFFSEDEPDSNNEIEISTAETVEAIVAQLMEKQRLARQAALVKQLECGCPDSTCADGKSCAHPMRRITAAKNNNDNKRSDNVNQSSNQVTSTTPNVLIGQRIQSHGGLLILNGQQQSFVCQPQQHNINHTQTHHHHQQQQHNHQSVQRRNGNTVNNKSDDSNKLILSNSSSTQSSHLMGPLVVPKQEAMDSSSSSSDKQTDNVFDNMSYSSTQQNTPIDSPLKESNVKDYNDSLQFFNETLDLSQEDIQKTLSANMPIGGHHQHHHNPQQQMQHHQHLNTISSHRLNDADQSNSESRLNGNRNEHHQHHDGTIGGDINPMDFIDHCDVVGAENVHGSDDDFVNLDAFDMLVEFPELELDGIKNGFLGQSTESTDSHLKKSNEISVNLQTTTEVFNISDYSPEWAYPEGGVKVLVTGPWHTESSYTVLFDSFPVPTTIVQSGVLRCYCPAHEVGLATLQVACDGYVISNSVMFEYKSPPKSEYSSELNTNEALFKFSLIDRFESINDRLKIKTEPGETSEEMTLFNQSNFEDRMVSLCHALRNKSWRGQGSTHNWTTTHRRMTLLHFASALGYSKLVCAMLTWRNENSNILLEAEIDALSQDCDGFTPLMWACAKGFTETAVMLYRWNSNALNVKNHFQQSPIEVASKNGYSELINEIEKLEIQQKYNNNNNNNHNSNSVAMSNNHPPPLTSLSSKSNSNSIIFTTISNSIVSSNNFNFPNQSLINSNNNFSYDSISNNRNFYNINTSNNLSSVFTTVSSALSSLTSSNITKENSTKHVNLSQCSLPASIGSTNSLNSNRSHDGVFLRPGAVSSALSPPVNNNSNGGNSRLSKRPSIDSGINIDIRSSTSALSRQTAGGNGNLNTTGKCLRDQLKLSRFERSMSLPITTTPPLSFNNSLDSGDSFSLSIDSSVEGSNNASNTSSSLLNSNCLASPLRKMDFALCEVSGDSSPIGNQQTTSEDDDDEHCCHQEGDNNIMIQEGVGVVGDSDAKVLTLAEQIIAAMPDRIKNESEELMSLGSPVTQETLSGDTSVMSGLNDTFMEPLLDSISNSHFDQEFNFEFGDQNYRYHDVGTPCSSLSPASSGPLQSPASYSIPAEPPMGSPSPPPTTQDFTEFLHASNSTLKPFEADFSNLTLTDREQRELYEAAKCIQKAYRSYKGRKKLEEQDKERTAAIVIQNYYRRYKQYAYYRQMTNAALVIQNKFRSYCEHKRFKKSQHQMELSNDDNSNKKSQTSSSTHFQNFYNNYQNEQNTPSGSSCSSGQTSTELSPSGPLKRTYSQRTQNQAARKIQQFMRQSKLKLQRERAEKERLVLQHRAEYLQSLQYQQGRQGVPSRDLSENIQQSVQQQPQQQNLQNHHQIRHLPSTSSQIPTNPNTDDLGFWN